MRKVLSLLLCVALLCSLVVITAQADENPAADFANAVTVPGGTVTVDVKITNNPGLTALRFAFSNTIGATYSMADVADELTLTANDAVGKYVWNNTNGTNVYGTTFGQLTISIPSDTPAGTYTFTVAVDQGASESGKVDLDGGSFTITVTNKVITGVNVAIDASLAIGIHVQTTNIAETTLTAVNVEAKKFETLTAEKDKEEAYIRDEDGAYIFYLEVNPWAMDANFLIDFTSAFVFAEGDKLDLDQLPGTAKSIGILSYCNKILGTSDELNQLIADLLEFGRQAQIYKNGAATLALPTGLAATEAAWENGDGDPCSFGDYCSDNYPETLTGKNSTAKKKFKFASADIEFGSQFVVTFTFANNGTTTAANTALVKVEGETYGLDGWKFEYAFNPAQYDGIEFNLYAGSVSGGNWCWINKYSPAYYAAYVNDNSGSAALLNVLEAFYNYGVSVETYVASLSE